MMASNQKLVAVAGGSSPTLGTAIVDALAMSKICSPVVISRLKKDEEQPTTKTTMSGVSVPIRYVDYEDEDAVVEVLKEVHTVICVIKIRGPAFLTTQLTLLKAAKRAGVKRFAPSEFELGPKAASTIELLAATKIPMWQACKQSGLEVARFQCGGFYQATISEAFKNEAFDQRTRSRIEKALHGLQDADVMWSLQRNSVHELITDEDSPTRLTITEISDIGRFVAAACELPDDSWKDDMSMVGETLRMDHINDRVEQLAGIKLQREKIDRKELQRRIDAVKGTGETPEEMIGKLWAQIEMVSLEDKVGAGVLMPIVNELCPQVKPVRLEDFLSSVFNTPEDC